MAKSSRGKQSRKALERRTRKQEEERFEYDGSQVFYTASSGITVECLPAAAEVEAARASVGEVDQEEYVDSKEITDVGGAKMKKAWDEESIKTASDEIKEQWAKYQEAVAALALLGSERIMRCISVEGIRLLDTDKEDEWAARKKFIGIDIPDKGFERVHAYVTSAVLRTRRDGELVMMGIARASGADENLLTQIEETFQDTLEEANRSNVESDQGSTGEGSTPPA